MRLASAEDPCAEGRRLTVDGASSSLRKMANIKAGNCRTRPVLALLSLLPSARIARTTQSKSRYLYDPIGNVQQLQSLLYYVVHLLSHSFIYLLPYASLTEPTGCWQPNRQVPLVVSWWFCLCKKRGRGRYLPESQTKGKLGQRKYGEYLQTSMRGTGHQCLHTTLLPLANVIGQQIQRRNCTPPPI